jgi:hypothetical protein
VIRRNEKLVFKAAQSSSIVTSLFPDNIRERLVAAREGNNTNKNPHALGERSLRGFLRDDSTYHLDGIRSKPLADLFLETTVLFGDIAGKYSPACSSSLLSTALRVAVAC